MWNVNTINVTLCCLISSLFFRITFKIQVTKLDSTQFNWAAIKSQVSKATEFYTYRDSKQKKLSVAWQFDEQWKINYYLKLCYSLYAFYFIFLYSAIEIEERYFYTEKSRIRMQDILIAWLIFFNQDYFNLEFIVTLNTLMIHIHCCDLFLLLAKD